MRHCAILAILIAIAIPGLAKQEQPQTEAALLAGADARIDKYRKELGTVKVVDAAGQPIPDARVEIRQIRHQFLFGCNAFQLMKYEDGNDELKYQQEFTDLFNYATLGFYWSSYEPEDGKASASDKLTQQARWLRDHGVVCKGHPLVWHQTVPRWAPTETDQIKLRLKRRVTNIVAKFAGLIDRWDVVNEAQDAANADNGVGNLAKSEGAVPYVAEAIEWARAANPKATLLYNDYKLDDGYSKLVTGLFEKNASVDALGLQSHMHRGEWPLTKVWDVCESFNRLGKPLHFTELTVLSGDHGYERRLPWPTTPEGEARQAEYVEKLYTLLFSHPAVQAITWWDLMDGGWQRAPAGLVRADLTPKPAYNRLKELIKGKWWTSEDLTSNSAGKAAWRGFLGRYRITVSTRLSTGTIDVDLERGKENEFTVRLQ